MFRCYEAASCLLRSFKDKLSDTKNSRILVHATISLFLHILHRANTIFDGNSNDHEGLCQLLRVNIRDLLNDWVVCGGVIGGSFFGGGVKKYAGTTTIELKKEEQELKVSEASMVFLIITYF